MVNHAYQDSHGIIRNGLLEVCNWLMPRYIVKPGTQAVAQYGAAVLKADKEKI
jgi:hypothetical protein